MRIILVRHGDLVDEVVMFVPDDFDRRKAEEEAANFLGVDPSFVETNVSEPIGLGFSVDEYRPYMG